MDISKCSNTECDKREECFRYRVKPSDFRQAYADFKTEQGCFSSIDGWDDSYLIPKGAIVKNLFAAKKDAEHENKG